jgi:hypothetical protein
VDPRHRTLRWWLLGAAVVLTAAGSIVWVVDSREGRVEFLLPILYCVLPAAVPLALAGLPSAGFRPLTIVVILVEAFVLLWGGYPLLAALPLQIAALFTRRPVAARVVARRLLAVGAATALMLAVTAFVVIPADSEDLVACIDPRLGRDEYTAANNAVFDVSNGRHVDGVTALGAGVAVDVDQWTTDDQVARLERRLRSIDGITRVVRGDPGRCASSG